MGCKSSKPDTFNIEAEYRQLNLPPIDAKAFENEFEKEAYIAINVLRANPKILLPQIKSVKGKKASFRICLSFKKTLDYELSSGSPA